MQSVELQLQRFTGCGKRQCRHGPRKDAPARGNPAVPRDQGFRALGFCGFMVQVWGFSVKGEALLGCGDIGIFGSGFRAKAHPIPSKLLFVLRTPHHYPHDFYKYPPPPAAARLLPQHRIPLAFYHLLLKMLLALVLQPQESGSEAKEPRGPENGRKTLQ